MKQLQSLLKARPPLRWGILPVLIAMGLFLTSGQGASAQATRTWVSGVGDDANPCSRTAPCKTFAGAISKTAPGGTINCLDPGGFGAVTITKSIVIDCEDTQGSILAAGTSGVIVNAATTDFVLLRGLSIEGANTGLNGVRGLAFGALYIEECAIHGFNASPGQGVQVFGGGAGTAQQVFISHSHIVQNGINQANGAGVVIGNTGSPSLGTVRATISDSTIERNTIVPRPRRRFLGTIVTPR